VQEKPDTQVVTEDKSSISKSYAKGIDRDLNPYPKKRGTRSTSSHKLCLDRAKWSIPWKKRSLRLLL
jgi:hypothetical protein